MKKQKKADPIIPIGSVWQDLDPRRPHRKVRVVGKNHIYGKVLIEFAGRVTSASPSRFNGKVGGYKMVSEK